MKCRMRLHFIRVCIVATIKTIFRNRKTSFLEIVSGNPYNTKWTIPYLLYQYVWDNPLACDDLLQAACDPDQPQQKVGPGLDPSCLTLRWYF